MKYRKRKIAQALRSQESKTQDESSSFEFFYSLLRGHRLYNEYITH